MVKYFVVFHAECDGDFPRNDVIEYQKEISSIEDIRKIEMFIEDKWFSDNRDITLINFKKI